MKKLLFLFSILAALLAANAQQAKKIHNLPITSQGQFLSFNANLHDTLGSNDTLTYIVPVTHTNLITPLHVVNFKTVDTIGDTTVTIKFYESMDNITYFAVKADTSDYTKTVSSPGTSNNEYNGNFDAEFFDSRYYKIMFFSKTKTGFKTIPYGYIKFNIK